MKTEAIFSTNLTLVVRLSREEVREILDKGSLEDSHTDAIFNAVFKGVFGIDK